MHFQLPVYRNTFWTQTAIRDHHGELSCPCEGRKKISYTSERGEHLEETTNTGPDLD